MMDTYFRTHEGHIVAASKLAVGDQVLDRHGHATNVNWCQVYQKERCLLVDLHAKWSMLTVTSSHRVVLPDGRPIEAKQLKRNDSVATDSYGCEQLQKVTQRYATIQVVELEFDRDATIPAYLPTILTKGSAPGLNIDDGNSQVKQESTDGNYMDIDTPGTAVGYSEYPDTEDGF